MLLADVDRALLGVPGKRRGTGGHVTEVIAERESLGPGVAMIYRDFGCHVRMAFDPQKTTEADAVALLRRYIPRLDGAAEVSRPADTQSRPSRRQSQRRILHSTGGQREQEEPG